MNKFLTVLFVVALSVMLTMKAAFAGFEIKDKEQFIEVGNFDKKHYYLNNDSVCWLENQRGPVITFEIRYMVDDVKRNCSYYGGEFNVDCLYDVNKKQWFVRVVDEKSKDIFWRVLSDTKEDKLKKNALCEIMLEIGGMNYI